MTKPAERRCSAPGPIHRKARPIAKSSPRSTVASDCDRNDGKEFPSPEDRTYCIKLLENYDAPSYDPRDVHRSKHDATNYWTPSAPRLIMRS
jgi:hypothetical protein